MNFLIILIAWLLQLAIDYVRAQPSQMISFFFLGFMLFGGGRRKAGGRAGGYKFVCVRMCAEREADRTRIRFISSPRQLKDEQSAVFTSIAQADDNGPLTIVNS